MEAHEIMVGTGFFICVFASMAADGGSNKDVALGAFLAGCAMMIVGLIVQAIKQRKRRKRR